MSPSLPFFPSFKYLFSTYYVPGSVLGEGEKAVNEAGAVSDCRAQSSKKQVGNWDCKSTERWERGRKRMLGRRGTAEGPTQEGRVWLGKVAFAL